MSDVHELDPCALCVQPHEALQQDCPVCGAKADECCSDEGETLPVYAVHIGRVTGGENLAVVHTGEYDEDGGAIFKCVEN